MKRHGQCLCGSVHFTAEEVGNFGACHCKQCQRWCGGPLLAVTVDQDRLFVSGVEHITSRRTSAWASRSHCAQCGSPLWYRHDRGIDGDGDFEVPIGLFDDANGLEFKREIFIDRKPDSFAFAGNHEQLTETETLRLYGVESDGL